VGILAALAIFAFVYYASKKGLLGGGGTGAGARDMRTSSFMHYEVYGKGGGAARSGAGMDSGSSVASSQDYSRSPYRREPAFVPYVSGGDAASVGSFSSYASSPTALAAPSLSTTAPLGG